MLSFQQRDVYEHLEKLNLEELHQLNFGVVRILKEGEILAFNNYESEVSGVAVEEALGKNFFTQVAPCVNNFMVAERYSSDTVVDEIIDYIFTYRVKATKVKLRIIVKPDREHQYLLVERNL